MKVNFIVILVCVTLSIAVIPHAESVSRAEAEESLPSMIKRYLEGVKTQLREQRKFIPNAARRNSDADQNNEDPPITLPDGLQPELVEGPGNPPRSVLQQTSKRSEEEPTYDLTCKTHEWFVFTDDMPACVNPIWEGGYDPTFCAKVKSGWVYCGCDKNQFPGMKEGLDTCVNKDEIAKGRCAMNPCPPPFKCEEKLSERRFDCVKGNLKVPTWY